MTNQEINEAVARALGYQTYNMEIPFCTDIAAAWEILEYCRNELVLYQIDLSHCRSSDTWFCALGTRNQENDSVGADTAPLAIALAFLKLRSANPDAIEPP